MAFEHKPGQFSLFRNMEKKADNHPDYRGDGVDIAGNKVQIAAWLKDSKKGKFLSCQMQIKRETQVAAPARVTPIDDDDSVPF